MCYIYNNHYLSGLSFNYFNNPQNTGHFHTNFTQMFLGAITSHIINREVHIPILLIDWALLGSHVSLRWFEATLTTHISACLSEGIHIRCIQKKLEQNGMPKSRFQKVALFITQHSPSEMLDTQHKRHLSACIDQHQTECKSKQIFCLCVTTIIKNDVIHDIESKETAGEPSPTNQSEMVW